MKCRNDGLVALKYAKMKLLAMKSSFVPRLLGTYLVVGLNSAVFAQLPAWGDYPRWPGPRLLAPQASDFQFVADLSRPVVRDWQRQQTALTQKLLASLAEPREFAADIAAQSGKRTALAQALNWQQQQFYSETGADGRCRVIVRQVPVGNERTSYLCEAGQELLGFRLAADASLLALLLQAKDSKTAATGTVVRLLKPTTQELLPETIPTASQDAHEIMPLPGAAGVLYRPDMANKVTGKATNQAVLLYWHRSGDALKDDKSAFSHKGTAARLILGSAQASTKLSLSWFSSGQTYPQVWMLDLEKSQVSQARFNWQRRFAASQQIRSLSFDDKALYWISARQSNRGKLWQQDFAPGSTAEALEPQTKAELWQVHASDGKLWLHGIAQGSSQLVKYDLNQRQSSAVDLPLPGRLTELAGELPGFLLESVQQAPLGYYINQQQQLKNWDIARPFALPFEVSEQLLNLGNFPDFQLRLLHKRGLELDGKHATLLMAEEVDTLKQLPRFNEHWTAWLARDGVLAWVQRKVPAKPEKAGTGKGATATGLPVMCAALVAAGAYLQAEGYASANTQFLWERAPAPACWWQLVQHKPEAFAAIASDQLAGQDQAAASLLKSGKYPALLLSAASRIDLKQQLSFMPLLGQMQYFNQRQARPILFRSEILGDWHPSGSTHVADDWGFFWWRYRQEQNRSRP